nr:hypothetical protein [Tanacetum cinerariifolium]
NFLPIQSECEVTSKNESKCDMPAKDDSSPAFTTFSNPLFNNNDNLDSSDNKSLPDEDVPTEEFKVYSNLLFDDDEINSDEIDPHCLNVEYDFVESLLNRDTFIDSSSKFNFLLKEFSEHNAEEERIKKVHAEYISRMEMLFTINPRPRPTVNVNTIAESLPSLPIPVQDGDSQREEIDIVTSTDELLPPGFENDDSNGEVDAVEELQVNNSISNSENEFSNNEESDFDNPSVPRPPLEPPDADFELDAENSVVMNDKLECRDSRVEFYVSNDDDYFPFMFIIRIFLPCLICSKVFSFLLSAESEDTIFDPGIFVKSQWICPSVIEVSSIRIFIPVHKIFASFLGN